MSGAEIQREIDDGNKENKIRQEIKKNKRVEGDNPGRLDSLPSTFFIQAGILEQAPRASNTRVLLISNQQLPLHSDYASPPLVQR